MTSVKKNTLPTSPVELHCHVVDEGNAPVPRAFVRDLGNNKSSITDENGNVTLICHVTHAVRFSLITVRAAASIGLGVARLVRGQTADHMIISVHPTTVVGMTQLLISLSLRHTDAILKVLRRIVHTRAVLATLAILLIGTVSLAELNIGPKYLRTFWFNHSLHRFNKHLNKHYTITQRSQIRDILPEQVVTIPIDSDHIITTTLTIPKQGALIIEPGTILRFGPNAGIVCHGSLIANGTPERLIRIQAAKPGDRWRNISIIDADAQPVRFQSCVFSDGGGASFFTPLVTRARSEEDLHAREATFRALDTEPPIGGALLIYNTAHVLIKGCEFYRNSAFAGGAIYIRRNCNVRVESSRFNANTSAGFKDDSPGGAVYVHSSDVGFFSECVFEDNQALSKYSCGGAVYVGLMSAADFSGVRFLRNSASLAGGAIYFMNIRVPMKMPPRLSTVASCEFSGNQATTGSGIYADQGSHVTVHDSLFRGNKVGIQQIPLASGAAPSPSVYGTIVVRSVDPENLAYGQIDLPSVLGQKNAVVAESNTPPFDVVEKDQGSANFGDLTKGLTPWLPIRFALIGPRLGGTAECYQAPGAPRSIDTIVIHSINASGWFSDARLRSIPGIQELEQEVGLTRENLRDHVYDQRLCVNLLRAYGVSAHYLINRDGAVTQLVPDRYIAFHAGESILPGTSRTNLNSTSIGIELVGGSAESHLPGGSLFTEEQYVALQKLVAVLSHTYKIAHLVGHSEIAPGRKTDPGGGFKWDRVRNADQSPLWHSIF